MKIMDTHLIVLGNEKGGSGKSTAAMHIIVALLKSGYKVGALDLDYRQQSLTRYFTNRRAFAEHSGMKLQFPEVLRVTPSQDDSRAKSMEQEKTAFQSALQSLADCHFIVIDCPGANTFLSRLAHAHADTILTPMNDSFVDFDLLARVDPQTREVLEPSVYSEIVWEARKQRAISGLQKGVDWVVMRNRLSATKAKNQKEIGQRLDDLSERIGFRIARGFGERVIFRELFPIGLTLLDLGEENSPIKLKTMSHLTARLEIRSLIIMLKLPAFDLGKSSGNNEVAA